MRAHESALESSQSQLVHDQLVKLLAHPSFLNKKRLGEFFNFVVTNSLNGDGSRLKESVIGVEVYHRDPSYNPKESPIVRTEARRLRALLEEYYSGDGLSDYVLIQIPKGAYVPRFEFRDGAKVPVVPEETTPSTVSGPLPLQKQAGWLNTQPWLKLAAGFLAACLLATGALTFIHATHPAVVWSAKPFSRLGGVETFSAFSPDGGKLAFVWSGPKGDNPDIYVQDLKADVPTRLTSNPAEDTRPAWSHDGKQIAFIRLEAGGRKELDLLSLQTGKETTVAELEGSMPWLCIVPRVSWSPDGRYLFTTESSGPGEACGVVRIDLKTRDIRRITQPPPGTVGDLEPDVSPDGKRIAFLRNTGEMGGDIYLVGVEGGPVQRVTFDNRDIMGFCWTSDGNSFIAASRRGDGVVKLWELAVDGRRPKQLTDGSALLAFPSIAPQGNRIAFTSYRNSTEIWSVNDAGRRPLISNDSSNSNPQLSPDGNRLVFRSNRTGSFEIWTSNRDGRDIKRLTYFNGPTVSDPAWSPDGKQIAFECRALAHSDICLASPDGKAEVRRFTQWSSNEILPSWSRDGHYIYFASNYSGRWEIYKQALAGGDPIAVTHQGGMRAVESWDGRYVYVHRGPPLGGMVRLPVEPSSGEVIGDRSENTVFLSELAGGRWGDWDSSPGGIVFLSKDRVTGASAVVLFNPASGTRRTLYELGERSPEGDRVFSITPDGRSFLYVAEKTYQGELGMLVRGG